ncbi:MAG: hypothetical protein ACR2JJ_05090 [Sphingomicrobium sp.]
MAALLRSDEPLDSHTRAVLARALDEGMADNKACFRLKFVAPADGLKSWQEYVDTAARHQAIADEFNRLDAAGVPKQKAYQAIIDAGLAKSDRTIDEARKYAREAIFRIRKVDNREQG